MGNAVQSYALAYGGVKELIKETHPKYNVYTQGGAENIRKPNVKAYMRDLLEAAGWNDNIMDIRTLEIAIDADPSESMAAIREYNKIRQRITEKTETKITGLQIVSYKDNPDGDDTSV